MNHSLSINTICFLICLFGRSGLAQQSPYSIVGFGAKGDGKTINTTAINAAIQSCHDKGGGTVLIPPGTFVSGTVVLRSNVNLHLEAGAILMGSKDTADYLPIANLLFKEGYNRYGLLYAHNARNVFVTGQGEINGQGSFFMNTPYQPKTLARDLDRQFTRQGADYLKPGSVIEDGPATYTFRPGLLMTLSHCENIRLTDVTLRDSPEWTIRFGDCDGVNLRGITIDNNPLMPNNDGIHCTNSRNVTISDCNILAGDDAIIVSGFGHDAPPGTTELLGNKTGFAENITVTNCVLSSRSACIRVGYGEYPIRNLVFSNLVMHGSNRGIGIFARTNSRIEHVLFSNIIITNRLHSGHWWGKGEPIHVSAVRDNATGNAGTINDIRFTNIIANSETGIVVQGSPDSSIDNLVFDGVKLTINNGKHTETYGGNFDFRPAYPLRKAIFKHDIPGFYAQYVNQLRVNNLDLNWGSDLPSFFTNGIDIDHFAQLRIENSSVRPAHKTPGLPAIKLSNGTNAVITNTQTDIGTPLIVKELVK